MLPGFPYWYAWAYSGKIPRWVELLMSGNDDSSLTSHEAGEEEEMNDSEDKLLTKKMINQELSLNIQETMLTKKHSLLYHIMVLIHLIIHYDGHQESNRN